MIVFRLEVAGFRCFRNQVAVDFAPDRINILHGPNGSGKSTLLWALARALLDTHRAGGRAVEDLRPWGTGLSPHIRVEFEHAGKRYRLEKRFLEGRTARLEELRQGRYLPLAEHENAEERVREMLLAERAPRELAGPERWGLARALWCPQDYLAVDGLSDSVLAQVRQVLGQAGLDRYAGQLKQQIEEGYARYWTPAGKARRGRGAPIWVQNEDKLEQLVPRLEQARAALKEFHTTQEQVRRLEQECERARKAHGEAKGRLEDLERRAAAWRERSAQLKAHEAQHRAKAQEVAELRQRSQQLAELRRELVGLDAREREIAAEMPTKEAARLTAERALEELRAKRAELDEAAKELTARDRLLAEAETYHKVHARQEECSRMLARHNELDERLRSLRDTLKALAAPDPNSLAQIERLTAERGGLAARLDAALLHIELRPSGARRIEVIRGDAPGPLRIAAGEVVRLTGSPVIEVELEGFGRVVVSGPAEGAPELRQRLAAADARLARLTAPFGTSDLEELRRRRQESLRLEAEIGQLERELAEVLAGRTVRGMTREFEQAQAERERLESAHPDWRQAPPEIEPMRRALTEERAAIEARRRKLDEEFEARQTELQEAAKECTRLEAEREALAGRRRRTEEQIRGLEGDGFSDAERAAQAEKAAVEALALETRITEYRAALAALGPDPEPELERARREAAAAEQSLRSAEAACHHHQGKLANLADQAPYEAVVRLEEEIAGLRSQGDADRRRADALKLLHDTVSQCESQVGAALSQTVADRASRLLARIAEDRIRQIRLGTTLAPAAVLPGDVDAEAALDALSAGEREQTHFAVRLALAELLTREAGERHLVALDDVLVVTDQDRLGRVLELLEELRPYAQFVILTCHPERYRALPSAHFIDARALADRPQIPRRRRMRQ